MNACLPSNEDLLNAVKCLGENAVTWRIYLKAMDLVTDRKRLFVMDLTEQLQQLQKEGLLCSIAPATVQHHHVRWMLTEKGGVLV